MTGKVGWRSARNRRGKPIHSAEDYPRFSKFIHARNPGKGIPTQGGGGGEETRERK